MDDSNGEFEIVDKKMAAPNLQIESRSTGMPIDPNLQSILTNVQPPSELPSFVTSLMPAQLPNPTTFIQAPAELVMSDSQARNAPSWQSSAQSSTAGVGLSTTSKPVTSQPLSPTCSSTMTEIGSKDATSEANIFSKQNNNWIGWIKGTVQSVGFKVAEKAKSSMDTMITTLDPQMKELINSGGDIDIIVASDKEVKVNPVREAFQNIFGKATVNCCTLSIESSNVASQPVGFEAVLRAAEDRINNVRRSGKIHPQQPVIAVEGFVTEFGLERWMELSLLLLDDPWHNIILQTFTQPTPIPVEFVKEAKDATPSDYPLIGTGYSVTIGSIAAQRLNVDHTLWQETLTEVSRRDTILLAAKSLAGLYRSSLPTDVI